MRCSHPTLGFWGTRARLKSIVLRLKRCVCLRCERKLYPDSVINKIYNVRPGLTGIGSIIFRDEERLFENTSDARDFYDNHIIPFKSKLEIWYVKNQSFTFG